jgi:long-chain acyl-CoA synthetase
MLTHGCVVSAMAQGQSWTTPYTTPGSEKVVCVLPLFHIYALSGIMLGAVRNGNQLILYPRPDIDMIVDDLGKKKPTFLPGVPTLYTAINKHPKAQGLDLKSLKICMSGGAPLPVEVPAGFREADRRDVDRRATASPKPRRPARSARSTRACASRARAACRCRAPSSRSATWRTRSGSCRLARSMSARSASSAPQVMKGYWKKPDETALVLFSHPASNWKGLRTGDMGYMDADGWLYPGRPLQGPDHLVGLQRLSTG